MSSRPSLCPGVALAIQRATSEMDDLLRNAQTTASSFPERLQFIVDRERSVAALVRLCGGAFSEGAVRKWLKGESDPARAHIETIARATGTSAEWLVTGRDPLEALLELLPGLIKDNHSLALAFAVKLGLKIGVVEDRSL